jgi:hypothetical protein
MGSSGVELLTVAVRSICAAARAKGRDAKVYAERQLL